MRTENVISKELLSHLYNIRGWLTNINKSDLSNDGVVNNDANDLFGMEFLYGHDSEEYAQVKVLDLTKPKN